MKLPPEQEAIRAKCFHPSGTFVEFPQADVETSIPQRFEKIVQAYPDRLAVKTQTESLTYRELDNAANYLARQILAKRGSVAEPVGVLIGAGSQLVATILAVLKSGKVVVLLDPSFPKARTSAILNDAQVSLLIADLGNHEMGRQLIGGSGEILSSTPMPLLFSEEPTRISIQSDDFAFIFYTSGSTGDPKAVIQTHRNVLHNIFLRMTVYNVSAYDKISLLAFATSNAVMNMFLAILNGAALLPFDVIKIGLSSLPGWMAQEKISICLLSSPLLRALSDCNGDAYSLPDLRALTLTSESVYDTDFEIFKKLFSRKCVLVTGLSSTETGPLRFNVMDHNTQLRGPDVPVGYALPGKDVFIVDDNGDRAGVNEVGEIVVSSQFLTPGYWRRPDLTKAKFKPDSTKEHGHVYCTGDLGMMLPDGCLVHKGRKDFRIKIRGYGVDSIEVEKALRSHPGIQQAVILPDTSESGETRLVAYFTSQNRTIPTVTELRRFLAERLAPYMIPSAFVQLKEIPLKSNNKIDRNALPKVSNTRPEVSTQYTHSGNETEEYLVQIWEQVLDIHPIGIHDNFFELGGHSLAATRVVSRVIKRFQLEIPLQSLFQSPTITDMAAVITAHQGKALDEQGLAAVLDELESLSDEEAEQLFGKQHHDISKE